MKPLEGINIVEISGVGCPGCMAAMPEARQVAAELGVGFVVIDAEKREDIPAGWSIERVPAIFLADGETEIFKCYGFQPEEILYLCAEDALQKYLAAKGESLPS
ncbi:MAG: thioredoxin family protein [Clostridia bacterium]|nr:thioredoxin family protein [Clostridia bacterium]